MCCCVWTMLVSSSQVSCCVLVGCFYLEFCFSCVRFTRLLPSFVPSPVSPGKLGLDSSDVAVTQALHTFCSLNSELLFCFVGFIALFEKVKEKQRASVERIKCLLLDIRAET